MKNPNEQFCYEVIKEYYDAVTDGRAEVFDSLISVFARQNEKHKLSTIEALQIWCDWESLPYLVADILARLHCDIYGIICELANEQKEQDREAREEYYDKLDDYRSSQGWK